MVLVLVVAVAVGVGVMQEFMTHHCTFAGPLDECFALCLQSGSLIFQMFKQKQFSQKFGESLVKVLTHFAEIRYIYALYIGTNMH